MLPQFAIFFLVNADTEPLFFMSFVSAILGLRDAVQLSAKSIGLGDGHASKPLSAPSTGERLLTLGSSSSLMPTLNP
jgi:hypothetical protein